MSGFQAALFGVCKKYAVFTSSSKRGKPTPTASDEKSQEGDWGDAMLSAVEGAWVEQSSSAEWIFAAPTNTITIPIIKDSKPKTKSTALLQIIMPSLRLGSIVECYATQWWLSLCKLSVAVKIDTLIDKVMSTNQLSLCVYVINQVLSMTTAYLLFPSHWTYDHKIIYINIKYLTIELSVNAVSCMVIFWRQKYP